MKKTAINLILILSGLYSSAQIAPQKYFIEFMDKNNSPYSLNTPSEYLSQRAIDRRHKQGIAVIENDLPANPSYINRIREYNVTILTRSKWFNGITIYSLNPSIIDTILQLPFVKRIIKSNSKKHVTSIYSGNKFILNEQLLELKQNLVVQQTNGYSGNTFYDYGPSYNQIHMLHGDSLHDLGFRGEGIVIAVLDAGFFHVDVLPAFDSLRINNQILGTKDFVIPGNNVYNEFEHGMEVLSCMGGNLPGQLIGTAPKAKYWLLRSEDVNSEFIIEEFNWVAAAEFADSAGADIINSSLSYTVFSDPDQDHTCADMDGNTTPATRGANIAESKGMIVVNSAGNLGASITWKCISAPADGYGVLSVAAVDSNGLRAGFSSAGVSTDRIKPNVAAMGKGTVVSSTVGTIMYNNGTSFSSPIIAGMAACLWEAAPGWNSRSIARAIELSGNQASNPDSLLGYGIPDFIKALNQVGIDKKLVPSRLNVFPNPFSDGMTLSFKSKNEQHYDLHLIDNLGQVRYSLRKQQARAGENKISLSGLQAIPPGSYILKVTGEQLFMSHHVVKVIN